MATERLQKIIARSGLCSRRDADRMISEGRVTVNGAKAVLGLKADPETDHIRVDGQRLKPAERLRYILLNKPRGVMTTCSDPEERTTVLDLLEAHVRERVFPVGRLDFHSEGLLLLTNDGELAARIAHPRYGIVRRYLVKVRGDLSEGELKRLLRGGRVQGRLVRPLSVRSEGATRKGGNTRWQVEVAEGRTHEVRELFFRIGHPVQRLRRTAIGPIHDDALAPGSFRELTAGEVDSLREATRGVAPPGRVHATRSQRTSGPRSGRPDGGGSASSARRGNRRRSPA